MLGTGLGCRGRRCGVTGGDLRSLRSKSAIRLGCPGLVSPEVSCHRAGIERIMEVWVSWKRVLRTRIPTESGWSGAGAVMCHGV
jgi:hypothetical protein